MEYHVCSHIDLNKPIISWAIEIYINLTEEQIARTGKTPVLPPVMPLRRL